MKKTAEFVDKESETEILHDDLEVPEDELEDEVQEEQMDKKMDILKKLHWNQKRLIEESKCAESCISSKT